MKNSLKQHTQIRSMSLGFTNHVEDCRDVGDVSLHCSRKLMKFDDC